MMVFLLAFLFIIVIPLAQGALLALLLREIHARHPLPLGGAIAVFPPPPKPPADSAKIQNENQESTAESAESAKGDAANVEEIKTILNGISSPEQAAAGKPENTVPPDVSVFDGSKNTSENLHVNDALDSMTAAKPAAIPDGFERRIEEEAAHASESIPPELQEPSDDMNNDDLQALSEALPGTKIDFTQELEKSPDNADAISPMAKELLGENFDFAALEQQAKETSNILAPDPSGGTSEKDSTKTDSGSADTNSANTNSANTDSANTDSANTDSANTNSANTDSANTNSANTDSANTDSTNTDSTNTDSANTDSTNTDSTNTDSTNTDSTNTDSANTDSANTDSANTNSANTDLANTDLADTDLAAAAIDVQEDESGNVQASSPFMFSATPQLAELTKPQTILSTFSDDWIQKMDGTIAPIEGDISKFCFTEEPIPMFVRKKQKRET